MLPDDEPVRVVEYDPEWAVLGAELVEQVGGELRGWLVEVEHIGSTAVPGLDAKPVIDLQVGCEEPDVAAVLRRIRRLGFDHLGQQGTDEWREYLRRRSGGCLANIHVVERGGRLWTDNVMFRDYLRNHPQAAADYARVKRAAAHAAGRLRRYSELKASTVMQIMMEMRAAADQ
ncbi:GrpB family protein [Nonomuraea sp. NPDC046802]|uniref:GrpB family protein n=1 Tax=Nonomuraea sp. NPDC046802 TaxID=3154919 RepID=UPI003408BDDE